MGGYNCFLDENLQAAGVQEEVRRFMAGVNQDVTAMVQFKGERSKEMVLDARLAQGSTWSPELATAFMECS